MGTVLNSQKKMFQILYGSTAAGLYDQAAKLNAQARTLYLQSSDTYYKANDAAAYDDWVRARHLADLKSGKSADQMGMHQQGDRTKCNCGGATGSYPCAPGTCGCANCSKNPDEKTTEVTAEQAEMEKVTKGDGKEGTKCNCGGADGKCPCPPGQCTCSGCSKAS